MEGYDSSRVYCSHMPSYPSRNLPKLGLCRMGPSHGGMSLEDMTDQDRLRVRMYCAMGSVSVHFFVVLRVMRTKKTLKEEVNGKGAEKSRGGEVELNTIMRKQRYR